MHYTHKKGSALVFTLLILSLVVMSSLTIASTTLTQRSSSIATGQSTAAFQNADRGMEILLQNVYNELSPLETLDDLAAALGGGWSCDSVSGALSDTGETFSLVATERAGVTLSCSTALADIERFKIVGEHKQAARALQITLQDSLKRGQIAYWNFEDNAEALRFDHRYPGAPAVTDASRFEHILTLCPEDQDNHGFTPFDACPQIINETNVDPAPANPSDIQDIYMDHGGDPVNRAGNTAWVDGVVDEKLPPYGSQALAFNGTSHYLTMNTETTGPNAVSHNDLGIDEAVSISLWIRPESIASATGQRIILENKDGSVINYALYLNDSDEIVFQLGNSTSKQITSDPVTMGAWTHVLATWDYSLTPKQAHLYVDGERESMTFGSALTRSTDTIWVGGAYDGADDDLFTVADFTEGYRGRIDDIRIYNRGLTTREMRELCMKADSGAYTGKGTKCGRF